jgi:tetratricopeptide (TPR) repeat protein
VRRTGQRKGQSPSSAWTRTRAPPDPVGLRVPRRGGARVRRGCHGRAAEMRARDSGWVGWWECQTCKQRFTGEMQWGLADAWWARARGRAEDDDERLAAATVLANSLAEQGKHPEAELHERQVLEAEERVLGREHPSTLMTKGNLARSLSGQGKHPEAEALLRQVLEAEERVLGREHPSTLRTKCNLANSLSGQGKHPEAELLERQVLEVQERVLGREHPSTLRTKGNLARSLSGQGKDPERRPWRRRRWLCRSACWAASTPIRSGPRAIWRAPCWGKASTPRLEGTEAEARIKPTQSHDTYWRRFGRVPCFHLGQKETGK